MNDSASPLRLHQMLSSASMDLNLREPQREGVLRALISKLKEIGSNPQAQETLLKALLEREALHSTGIGDGVALPHARNALVGLVETPAIVFGRHVKGIPYGAVDGKDAHLFFLLVAPNVTSHLQMLAKLSRVLRHVRVRESLLAAESAEKVIAILRDAESTT